MLLILLLTTISQIFQEKISPARFFTFTPWLLVNYEL